MSRVVVERAVRQGRMPYSGHNRRLSLTERMILAQGFGPPEAERTLSTIELAGRLEVSVHSLNPHLRTLLDKGEVETAETGRYRRVA